MSQLKYRPYTADKSLLDDLIGSIPRLVFFNKEGYQLQTNLISAISFKYTKGKYSCDGIVNLYYNKTPELIIQNQSGNYYDDFSIDSLVFFNIENNSDFVVQHAYIKEKTFKTDKLSIGNSKVDVLTLESIILDDDFKDDLLFKDFIKDIKLPCIRWGGSIETEPTSVEFISSDVINILEARPQTEEIAYSFEEYGNVSQGLDKITTHNYYTPFSGLKVKAHSDESLPEDDLFSIKKTPYFEFPNLMLGTTQSDENFIIDVDYTKERLDKVPFKVISRLYKTDDLEISGFLKPYIELSLGSSVETISENKKFERYFKRSLLEWDIDPVIANKNIADSYNKPDQQDQQFENNKTEYHVKKTQKPLSFHIGISSDEEGIYSTIFDLYIVIERISAKDIEITDSENAFLTDVLYIGQFNAYTEIKGYDDRYRTFFTNFGIPDPIDYPTIFKSINPLEDYPNADIVNKKSKELFLSYKDIFPYRGTYKALLNAVKFLGYEDLYFREWYKTNDINNQNTKDYLTYIGLNVKEGLTLDNKLKSVNIDFETYMNLIKLNKLSMVYQINREQGADAFGVPSVVDVYNYKNADILVKLYSVREWLEKHIIGVNCQITDLTGEGIYFQRFKSVGYPNSITNFDVTSHLNLTPKAFNNEYLKVLDDNTDEVRLNVTLAEYEHTTFNDIGQFRISDFVKYILDLTPVKRINTGKKDSQGQDIYSVSPVTNKSYYDLKDKNGFFNLFTDLSGSNDPGILPGNKSKDSFVNLNLDFKNRKETLLDPNIDNWDVNNIFQVPISARLDCPVLFDNVTYNLENRTPNGAFYNALNPSVLLKSDLEATSDDSIYQKYNYHSLVVDESDRTKSNFINSIILDKRELQLLDYRYDLVDFKYLPSFRIKSGKIRRLGLPINVSSIFSMDLVVTDQGQVRYGLKSEKYSDRPYEKYLKRPSAFGAPLTKEELDTLRKNQMFTLDRDIILSNDYFTFVPDYFKTSYDAETQTLKTIKPKCRFEYVRELDGYYFIVKGYKIQFNDTLAVYDMSNVQYREEFNIRKEFKNKIDNLEEFIIDIFDGSIVSEIKEPKVIEFIEDRNSKDKVLKKRNSYLTEELDYQLLLNHAKQNDTIDKNFIYKHIQYKVPVFEVKQKIDGYSGLIQRIYKEGFFNSGSITKTQSEKDKLTKLLGETNNLISDFYKKAQDKIDIETEIVKGKGRFRDLDSYKKVMYMHYSSLSDATLADSIQNILTDSIVLNDKISFDVNNIGDYKIEAFAYDKYNNTYRAQAKDFISVSQNEKDIWTGSQYLDQGKYPDFFELKSIEEGPHDITEILGSRFRAEDILKQSKNDSEHQVTYKNNLKLKLNYFNQNEHPKFPKLERYIDISVDQNSPRTIQYETRPYLLDGNFLSFSNITDSAYDIDHSWDQTNIVNVQLSDEDKSKPLLERPGVHNLKFRLSLNNVYVNNLYDIGTRLDCVIYDVYNNQYLGHIEDLIVTGLVQGVKNDIIYADLICDTLIDTDDKLNKLKVLKEYDKNPYIRFYFVRSTAYTVVNYVNNIDERNCVVKIKTDKTENFKFNRFDVIKIRKAQVGSYRIMASDNKGTFIEIIPTYSEVAYRVLDVKPYKYELKNKDGEKTEFIDRNYQLVTLDGFIDQETTAKIKYREDLFGNKSKTQSKYEKERDKKYDPISFIPFTSFNKVNRSKDIETLIFDYNELVAKGFMSRGKRTELYEKFIKKYFNKYSTVRQPGTPIYYMRELPKEGAIIEPDGNKLIPYLNPADAQKAAKYIVYLENFDNKPDWFIESIIEENNDITNLQSFINRLSENREPLDMTMLYAHDRFVTYPFIATKEVQLRDRSKVTLEDPYKIFKYLDSTFSFTSNDFDIETAYRDWVSPITYRKYNIQFYNRPTLVENFTDYIITSDFKKDKNTGIKPDKKRYISKWAICQNIEGGDYLLYRFMNDSLFLKNNNPNSVFNVYLDTIDEHGNKVTTAKQSNVKFIEK